jgi:hypothetical protein
LLPAVGQADKDSLVAWYHKHYPFATMDDSIFTFETEFELPVGFQPLDSSRLTPFQNWIANFPLWHRWKGLGSWRNMMLAEPDSITRCLHLPYRGPRQKHYNIPLRIITEWLYKHERYFDLVWLPHKGDTITYDDFLGGELRLTRYGEPFFTEGERREPDDYEYYDFMGICMDYNSPLGLTRNCTEIQPKELLPGDLLVGHDDVGKKGHTWVVVQVIENGAGERRYVVATGCDEACDFYIPKLTDDRSRPWLTLEQATELVASWPHHGCYRLNLSLPPE